MKQKLLIQLDTDAHPSVFDRVVAIDAGADHLFSYGNVRPTDVQGLVHGAMFTRGVDDLKSTAIFIGGSDVAAGEAMLKKVSGTFFGPLRVSVMLDANGANTTAAAAVLAAGKHLDLAGVTAVVLGGTGPVGVRVARLLARQGAKVRIASRSADRAQNAAAAINAAVPGEHVTVAGENAHGDAQLIVSAGAAGVRLFTASDRKKAAALRVMIDLNAVPPTGIEGVEITDKAKDREGVIAYGAIGVGGTKMKIHRAAIAALFESNDKVLDAEAIYQIGQTL